MIKKNILRVVILHLVFAVACTGEKKSPKEYFDKIVIRTDSVVSNFNDFINGSTYYQVDSMKIALIDLQSSSIKQQIEINKIENWNEDAVLKNAAIEYVVKLKDIGNQELKMMMDIYSKSDTLISDDDNIRLDSIAGIMDIKINSASLPFLKAQAEFAKKNNFKLNFDYEIDPSLKSGMDTTVLVK